MTFQLDTSGGVCAPIIDGWAKWPHQALSVGEPMRWPDLSPFAQGYIEALFASVRVDALGATYAERPALLPRFSDLAPETLARIIADCEAIERHLRREQMSTGGARAWELRQSGFWPKTWPPLTVQLCDDGKVRLA